MSTDLFYIPGKGGSVGCLSDGLLTWIQEYQDEMAPAPLVALTALLYLGINFN